MDIEIEMKTGRESEAGITLSGDALIVFKTIQSGLTNRRKAYLENLLPKFLDACDKIIEYCPEISRSHSLQITEKKPLTTTAAKNLVGNDLLDEIKLLFDIKLTDEASTIETKQTEEILGTFFIVSFMQLYTEISWHTLFQNNLRKFAEKLRQPALSKHTCNIIDNIDTIVADFTQNMTEIEPSNLQKEFESIFIEVKSQNQQQFTKLITLFFYKPFPTAILENARFFLKTPQFELRENIKLIYRLDESIRNEQFSENASSRFPVAEDNLCKHITQVKTAFEVVKDALNIVNVQKKIEILNATTTSHHLQKETKVHEKKMIYEITDPKHEFEETIEKVTVENLNPVFEQYLIAFCERQYHNKFQTFFSTISKSKAVESLKEEILKISRQPCLIAPTFQTETVLAPPVTPLDTVTLEDPQYRVLHLALSRNNHETFAALLNANPLIKALLLSQVPIAVILQILRVDNHIQDVSTIMWCEPILGLIGFACGVYALKNPKTLVNTQVRILEALASSSVVLTNSLSMAILAHTALFPAESNPGGIDIERFLTVVSSAPIALSLLSWMYNSMSPGVKAKCFSRRARFMTDYINYFMIYSGLIQITSIDLVKMAQIDFSSELNRSLFEFLPMLPAVFFAYTRIAPIRTCSKKQGHYINISETINTVILYAFTSALSINLIIKLYFENNLSTAQTNFRRFFFPGLCLASIAVMRHFYTSFNRQYVGNPEIIIEQIIKEDGFQPTRDGTFRLVPDQPLLLENEDSEQREKGLIINAKQREQLERELSAHAASPERTPTRHEILPMLHRTYQKNRPQNNDEGQQARANCRSCTIL